MMCVENTQKLVELVTGNGQPGVAMGLLPWWYRIFYLYTAGLHLVAAKLRPDLFEPGISACWSKLMHSFAAHESLSPYVPRSVSTLRGMWQKVADILTASSGQSWFYSQTLQDVYEGVGLDFDEFIDDLGMDDTYWVNGLDWDPTRMTNVGQHQ